MAPWDKELVELSQIIHQMRDAVFRDFLSAAKELIKAFSKEMASIEINYLQGWSQEKGLAETLADSFERDVKSGYTHIGPHRADLKFLIEGKVAADVLSRGQEKSLIMALHIAQAKLYQEKTDKPCVFLIDDLMAELDSNNAARLATWLNYLKGQVFVTGVAKEQLLGAWDVDAQGPIPTEFALFHVEQGHIEAAEIHK